MSNPIKCRGCGALIAFVMTPKSHRMPVDADVRTAEADDPEKTVVTLNGHTVKGVTKGDLFYIPHWQTCNDPKRFRRRDA